MYVWILIIIAIYCILPISFMNYIILYIIFIMILIPYINSKIYNRNCKNRKI